MMHHVEREEGTRSATGWHPGLGPRQDSETQGWMMIP